MKADPGKTLRIACSSAYLALESHSEWRAIPMSYCKRSHGADAWSWRDERRFGGLQSATGRNGDWDMAKKEPHGSDGSIAGSVAPSAKGKPRLLNNLDQPLIALAEYCQQILASDYHLKEIVREADAEWGRRMDERPHFNREGSPTHPDDPYTNDSVRTALRGVLATISGATGEQDLLSTPSRPRSDIP